VSWMGVEEAGTAGEGWDGFALLVDDVLRQTGTATNFSLAGLDTSIVHYFRCVPLSRALSPPFIGNRTDRCTWFDAQTRLPE
jgi:hypothetical protein